MQRRVFAAAFLITLLPTHLAAQHGQPPTIMESYGRARAILDAAIDAHGGMDALRAARRLSVRLEGTAAWRAQSRRVDAPWDTLPYRIDLHVELDRGRLVLDRVYTLPGGFDRASRIFYDGTASTLLDFRTRTHRPWRQPMAEGEHELALLPQFLLLRALEGPWDLRHLGAMRLDNGETVDAIVQGHPASPTTLFFDRATHLLRGTASPDADAIAGDMAYEVQFTDYRMLGGVLLPTHHITRTAGELTRDLTYVAATVGAAVADSLLRVPDNFIAPSTAAAEPVRTLAPGIWLVGTGYASLVVELADHLVVVDAPESAGEVIAQAARLAAGKPIRFVVPTHHHDDHATGVKQYAVNGTTIVTTPANRDIMDTIARSRPTYGDDSMIPRLAGSPRIETFTGRREFTDGQRTLEIHDIGPGPHAEELLVAWLPAEGILFEADLLDLVPAGPAAPGTNNETTAHFARWLAQKGWTVRSIVGAHGSLGDPALLRRILERPVSVR